ncbi:MAG TPA: hypothetical protein VGM64_01030 [Lacunisphaera sp.]|jgi:hypothetical protein
MKTIGKLLFGAVLLAAVEFGFSGCVADGGGYVSGSESIYYGSDPWFHDGPWLDGRPRYRHAPGAYIHPPAYHVRGSDQHHTPDHRPAGSGNHAPTQHSNPSGHHDQDHRPNQDRH